MLTRQLHQSSHIFQSERFASVQFTKIDGFGDVGVRFCPVLTDLIHQPRHQFKFALTQQFGSAKKQVNALRGTVSPRSEARALLSAFRA